MPGHLHAQGIRLLKRLKALPSMHLVAHKEHGEEATLHALHHSCSQMPHTRRGESSSAGAMQANGSFQSQGLRSHFRTPGP